MINADKDRADFELCFHEAYPASISLSRDPVSGDYIAIAAHRSWLIWQAHTARSAAQLAELKAENAELRANKDQETVELWLPEGWKASHPKPWDALTEEAQQEKRYSVERTDYPWSAKNSDIRVWSGPTLDAALRSAHAALGMPYSPLGTEGEDQ